MSKRSPFHLMHLVFVGLGISLAYGLLGSLYLFLFSGNHAYSEFLKAFTLSFKTLISLGLILGTTLVVFRTQGIIPRSIENAFTRKQLAETSYSKYRSRFVSRRRSVTFAAEFVVAAFIIFSFSKFPLSGAAENLMILAVCVEYACGVYVGRKLCYAGMMLHSLLNIKVTRNLFKKHELSEINTYVNIISTLTIVFVYVHVRNYYNGPFQFNHAIGESIRALLVLPAIIATPVLLIFNFYPRMVLRSIYSQSIDVAVRGLQRELKNEKLSAFERMSYLIEYDKLSRDEMRYRLRLTLSDLPIGITILIMVLGPLVGK